MSKDTSPSESHAMSLQDQVAHWIRPEIQALNAYHVPGAAGLIKLDAMENPYHWPEDMISQWLEILRDAQLNRYPDPAADELKQQLRKVMAIPSGADILLGNGSDEIIQIIMMTMSESNRTILSVEPGFVMYQMIATFTDIQYVGVSLKVDFSLDRDALLDAIKVHQPAVVFLAYPNNPTGNLFDKAVIEAILDASPGIVIIDEAYHAFADSSFMPRVMAYDNLLVMRTVSKMGLAGLRLGLLVGQPAWLNEFDKVRLPYNINILTQISTRFALQHHAVLEQQTRQIKADRDALFDELLGIEGLTIYPSRANFILFRVAQGNADQVFKSLKEKGILIKNLNKAGGMLTDCLRVTVGKPDENAAFLTALKQILGQQT